MKKTALSELEDWCKKYKIPYEKIDNNDGLIEIYWSDADGDTTLNFTFDRADGSVYVYKVDRIRAKVKTKIQQGK
jgi:hypothetical protein